MLARGGREKTFTHFERATGADRDRYALIAFAAGWPIRGPGLFLRLVVHRTDVEPSRMTRGALDRGRARVFSGWRGPGAAGGGLNFREC